MASHLDVQKPEIPSVLSEFSLNRPLFTMDKEESIALLKSASPLNNSGDAQCEPPASTPCSTPAASDGSSAPSSSASLAASPKRPISVFPGGMRMEQSAKGTTPPKPLRVESPHARKLTQDAFARLRTWRAHQQQQASICTMAVEQPQMSSDAEKMAGSLRYEPDPSPDSITSVYFEIMQKLAIESSLAASASNGSESSDAPH